MSYTSTRSQAETYIEGQLDSAEDVIDDARIAYSSAMAELADVINGLSDAVTITIPGNLIDSFVSRDISLPAPVWNIRDLEDFTNPELTSYVDVPIITGVSLPDEPDNILPVTDIPFIEQYYYSSLLDSFRQKLLSGIAGGVTGIDDAYEAAIYERDRLRREAEATKAELAISVDFAKRGFSRPSGAYVAAIAQVRRDKVQILGDASRDAMVKRVELEQQYVALLMQAIPQMESITVDYHGKVQDRKYTREHDSKVLAVDVWKTTWQRYRDLLEAAKIESDLAVAQVNAAIETNRGIGTMNALRLEESKTIAEMDISRVEAEIKSLEGAVSVYVAKTGAASTAEEIRIRGYEAETKGILAEAEYALKAADASVQALIATKSVLVEAAKANSSVSAQVLASALNSVNTALSYGYAGHIGYNNSYDESKHVAAGAQTTNYHYFDETGV